MNRTTSEVIEFLNHPELDFGVNPTDVELLDNPDFLHQAVYNMLTETPALMGSREASVELKARLIEADWPLIAREIRTRLRMASRFFEKDV